MAAAVLFPRRWGFGDVPATSDPDYLTAVAALNRARSFYTAELFPENSYNWNLFWNHSNLIGAIASGALNIEDKRGELISRTTELNSFYATGPVIVPPGQPVAPGSPTPPPPVASVPTVPLPPVVVQPPVVVNHPPPAAAPNFLQSIENYFADLLQPIATQTGLSMQTIEIGAAVLVIGGLWYLNSSGGHKRK